MSTDDGITWSTPEDISLNDEKWVDAPTIVSDTNNHLVVTYDYNVGDPNNTIILIKNFNGISWSEADTITPDMPGSRHSKLVFDTTGRLYCFWHHDINNGTAFYKYFENGQWSEALAVLPGNNFLAILEVVCDQGNKLHCIGAYHTADQTPDDNRAVYLYMINDVWSTLKEISEPTSPGKDIDVDSNNEPHVAFRQDSPNTPPYNDSTMYRYLTDTTWSEPELVVEDPRRQKILIDENNKPNIFDVEKTEEGSMLMHHYKMYNTWEGYIIDESIWNTIHYAVANYNYKLYAAYLRQGTDNDGEIFFSKTGIITDLNNFYSKNNLRVNVFPNPFQQNVRIRFELNNTKRTLVGIYTMQGKLIKTIINQVKPAGEHEIQWGGKDKNGNQVANGLYLVRVRAGNNIVTRLVELMK